MAGCLICVRVLKVVFFPLFDPHATALFSKPATRKPDMHFWTISCWLEMFSFLRRVSVFFCFLFYLSATNTEDKHIRTSLDEAPPASVPISSAICRASACPAALLGQKTGVCHPAERVQRSAVAGLQSRAQRRARGGIASDTGHPTDALWEDLWEVDVLHLCGSVCLPETCLPSQPASPPTWPHLLAHSALNPAYSEVQSGSLFIHLISFLNCAPVSWGWDLISISIPFRSSWVDFPCLIVIFALMMTINSSLIFPRFLLMWWLIRAR